METGKIKSKLLIGHLYLLGFIMLNFVIEKLTGFGLNQSIIFILKVILYISGILLLFFTIKPFKSISIYFSIYALSGIIIGLFFLLGGILLAILSSIFLYPIYPKQVEYENQSIRVYDTFQGFLSACCSYEVAEPKLYIFEKKLGLMQIENPINEKDEFRMGNNEVIYKHEIKNSFENNTTTKVDTVEHIKLK